MLSLFVSHFFLAEKNPFLYLINFPPFFSTVNSQYLFNSLVISHILTYNRIIMSIADTLIFTQRAMTRYMLPIIIVFGNIGNIILIGILLQKQRRLNSCSIYLLAASVFGLIITNWTIIPHVYAVDHVDFVGTSLPLCRIRGYIIHSSSMCFRYIIVLACIDRYAMCSSKISIRNYCRPRIAYYSIAFIIIIWFILSIHQLLFESIKNGRCSVYELYGSIFRIYSSICFGIIPTTLMIIFSILLMIKLRQIRSRIQPFYNNIRIRRVDSNLGRVILTQVIVSILCTFAHPLMLFYLALTNDITSNKSSERLKIESFINFITMSLLLYVNYNTMFYVYFIISKSFRNSIKQLVMKCWTTLKYGIRNIEHDRNV
jgi:hypothetical protein